MYGARILFNASDAGGFALGEVVRYGTTTTAVLGLSRELGKFGDQGQICHVSCLGAR